MDCKIECEIYIASKLDFGIHPTYNTALGDRPMKIVDKTDKSVRISDLRVGESFRIVNSTEKSREIFIKTEFDYCGHEFPPIGYVPSCHLQPVFCLNTGIIQFIQKNTPCEIIEVEATVSLVKE